MTRRTGRTLLPSLILIYFFLIACSGGGSDGGPAGFIPSSPGYTPSCTGASPTWSATPDYQSVSDCVSRASAGDTINITAGRATWSQILNLGAKRLSIIGAGMDDTIIEAASNGLCLFRLGTGGSRLAHLSLYNKGGALYIGGGQGFSIDHIHYNNPSLVPKGEIVINADSPERHPTGIIHSCRFVNVRIAIYGATYNVTDDNSSHRRWAQPQTMGGTDEIIYVEGNTFLSERELGGNAIDTNCGGRYVFRYNTITTAVTATSSNAGQYIEAHSIQAMNRATQRWEIYNNVLDNQGGQTYYPFRLRGGTGVAANNHILGKWTNFGIALDNVRSYADYSGTHNGGNGLSFLSNSSASFASMYFVGSLVKNTTAGSECISTSGTATTMSCVLTGGTRQLWNNGDAYRITRPALAAIRPCDGLSEWDGNEDETGWPCRDQIGRGHDAVQWSHNPAGTYDQPLMPAYAWNNKRTDGTTEVPFHVINDSQRHIKPNRDYYDYTDAFDGTTGVGRGTLSSRPASCTVNTAYFAVDEGNLGTLYKCTAQNTWTAYFEPAPCPHPLTGLAGQCTSQAGTTGYNR